jgi:hypothetical protein
MFGDNILSSTPADNAPITITVTGLPTTVTLAVVKVANNTVPAVSNSTRLCYNGRSRRVQDSDQFSIPSLRSAIGHTSSTVSLEALLVMEVGSL